jgi:4-hydroxy-tetrahydrodipicolinate synthase
MNPGTPSPLPAGLWGVLATPFHGPELDVDLESLRREAELYAEVPATGLVVLGVFGEGASLDSAEQATVVAAVAQHVATLPLVVGVAGRTTAVAVEQARTAVASGGGQVQAVMVQVNTADPVVLGHHLRAVHEAAGVGLVLQDYPETSGVTIGPAEILRVLDACPFVVAVKSEAHPTAAVIGQLTASTSVPVFGGLGGVGLLDELAAGAAGTMTGFSHPEGLRAALDAWALGGYAAARAAFAPWLPLVNFEAQPGIGLALRKEILHRRGLFADPAVRPPARSVPDTLLRLLPDHLAATPTTTGS